MNALTMKAPLVTFGWARLGWKAPVRDYLMAHAPTQPQDWFQPVMATPEPQAPEFMAMPEDPAIQGPLLAWWHRRLDERELPPAARQWLAEFTAAGDAATAWHAEREKQRHVQWPAAWADAVLAAANRRDA